MKEINNRLMYSALTEIVYFIGAKDKIDVQSSFVDMVILAAHNKFVLTDKNGNKYTINLTPEPNKNDKV